jgi:NAD(P)H-hydrate epimerase
MIKILSSKQIRAVDQYTIGHNLITSIDLMEKASRAFVSSFIERHGVSRHIKIFCGNGNNGGDGLAISRLLIDRGCSVQTYCIGNLSSASPDFKINFERLKSISNPLFLNSKSNFPELHKNDIVIDGIFGSGLSRPVEGLFAELIDFINFANCKRVIAIDIASGLFSDQKSLGNRIIECDETISFQIPKLAFYLPQNNKYVGQLTIVDIGLNTEFIDDQKSQLFIVTKEYVQSILKNRNIYTHKGSMGRNLLIAGSKGKMGAAILSVRACLRSGAGLVTAYIPECGYNILQTASPESMVITDPMEDIISHMPSVENYNSIGIGPGIGTSEPTVKVLRSLLADAEQPLVLDADALNIISKNNLMELIPENSVLTPHPGEFERLVGKWSDDYERLDKQIELSRKRKIVILLKGAYSSISDSQGKVCFNTTGNPGMATAGSGDVLTGIITSLIGQGYKSYEAAILGSYLHGLAGNLFVSTASEEGLVASDLIKLLPKAFSEVRMK